MLPVYTATAEDEDDDVNWLLIFGRKMPHILQLVTHLSPMKELWGHESLSLRGFGRL